MPQRTNGAGSLGIRGSNTSSACSVPYLGQVPEAALSEVSLSVKQGSLHLPHRALDGIQEGNIKPSLVPGVESELSQCSQQEQEGMLQTQLMATALSHWDSKRGDSRRCSPSVSKARGPPGQCTLFPPESTLSVHVSQMCVGFTELFL